MTAALVLWIEKGVRTPMVFTYLTLGRSIVQSSVLVYNLVFLFGSIMVLKALVLLGVVIAPQSP